MRHAALALWLLVSACGADLAPYSPCSDDGLRSDAGFTSLAPELLVPNVDLGVAWYRDVAGFSLLYDAAATRSCFAELGLEGSRVLLSHRDAPFDPPDNSIELRFLVADVNATEARLRGNGATFVRPIATADYGLRDFVVRDVYGFRVRFAQPVP